MNQKKQRTIAIFALAIALVATTIAYAVLSTTLSISGSVTKKGGSWDVHLANVSSATTTGTAKMTTAPNVSGTTVSFDANLYKPGDSVAFTFDIVNGGTIDATMSFWDIYMQLGSANNVPSAAAITKDDVTYTIYYKNNGMADWQILDGISKFALNSGSTMNIKIVLTYNESATSIESSDVKMNVTASFPFVQA